MSIKSDRLVSLLPQAWAARERDSLLFRLLDAIGLALTAGDEVVKALLKSHWVDHAVGPALDGLGALLGTERRTLRDGSLESDDALRQRLRSLVSAFTGGGTVAAVLGAVRSALGLPFDLDELALPPGFAALREEIEQLVVLEEFSPDVQSVVDDRVTEVDRQSQLVLGVDSDTVFESAPQLSWTLLRGSAEVVSVARGGAGVMASGAPLLTAGSTLRLSSTPGGVLSAVLDGRDVTARFTNLDGTTPPRLPSVPPGHSDWVCRAGGGFDLATWDRDAFDLPDMRVALVWTRTEPLTFNVRVPYFLQRAIAELAARHRYPGQILVYEGLPLERIQEVVDRSKAAGVRGSVQFSLNFYESHDVRDPFAAAIDHARVEDQAPVDELDAGSFNTLSDRQDVDDGAFALGGVFDASFFGGPSGGVWAFQ